jgi:hypothetical protein
LRVETRTGHVPDVLFYVKRPPLRFFRYTLNDPVAVPRLYEGDSDRRWPVRRDLSANDATYLALFACLERKKKREAGSKAGGMQLEHDAGKA